MNNVGAINAVDKTGTKFNKLIAVERIANYKGNGKTYYKCLCECGNYIYVSNDRIGKAYSCGCETRRSKWKRIDHTGQRFGMLTVKEMLYGYKGKSTYAKCQCDCGNETIAFMGNIKKGATKSCGCYESLSKFNRKNHEKDLTGMKFGHLTVLELTEKRYENHGVGWLCECDCGNICIIRSSSLIRGHTRTCGCGKISKYEEYVEEILNSLDIQYDREFKYIDCRNRYPLPFDFHFIHNNIEYFIETQGQQHYIPVKAWDGEDRLKRTQGNDEIKRQYCIDHNIVLIRLPYTMSKDEMKQEIMNTLNPVTTTVA